MQWDLAQLYAGGADAGELLLRRKAECAARELVGRTLAGFERNDALKQIFLRFPKVQQIMQIPEPCAADSP